MLMMALTIFLGLAGRAHATKYYIAANGSDSNSGTSEASPWLHAPGMPNCTGTCASTTPAAGDNFIFRGGDAWHRSANINDSSDVAIGGEWNFTWSGSGLGSTCDYYNGAVSTCIYIGVSTSWYNSAVCGSSFCRPKFEMDNPIWANSTHQDASNPGFITACTYDDNPSSAGLTGIKLANGIIFDNWEMWGLCWVTPITSGYGPMMLQYPNSSNSYDAIIDGYIHGWTEAYDPQTNGGSSVMDQAPLFGGTSAGGVATHNVMAYNTFDGSDSCPEATVSSTGGCTGGPVRYGDFYYTYSNVFRWMSLIAINYNAYIVRDNLFEHIIESYDPASHSQVFEMPAGPNDCPAYNEYYYNNITREVAVGITWEISTCGGYSTYIFNNVFWQIGNGANCLIVDGTQTPTPQLYISNNTFEGQSGSVGLCTIRFLPAAFTGNVTLQNNHFIGPYTGPPMNTSNFINGSGGTVVDNGNEIVQTESVANAQGYTSGNNYQPTSTSGATYHAGSNLSTSCATYSPDLALCSGSTGAVMDIAGSGIVPVPLVAVPLLRGAAWDAGAYQYSETSSGQPTPPMGLIASVQ